MAAYNSRAIVEDYLRYKLLEAGGHRRRSAASSASSWRSEGAMTSQRVTAPDDTEQAPPRLLVVLRCAVDELERRYRGDLSAQVSALLLSNGGRTVRRRSLAAVREELFRDGVNWGRIVAMMALGGALCTEVVKTGGRWQVDDIARWMEESLDSPLLQEWMEDSGGWDAFVQLYGESRPLSTSWFLRTALGLAVLGAAGIILGILFTQR